MLCGASMRRDNGGGKLGSQKTALQDCFMTALATGRVACQQDRQVKAFCVCSPLKASFPFSLYSSAAFLRAASSSYAGIGYDMMRRILTGKL